MRTADVYQVMDRLVVSDVARMTAACAWPSISVLIDTAPGEQMSEEDARRLARMVEEVEDRLRDHGLRTRHLMSTLRRLADEASRGPTGRGLAIFVSQAVARRVRLAVPVQPRSVVERTFATRDLIHALHRTPPHLVLLLHAGCAHLYRGHGDALQPVREQGFPFERALHPAGARRDDAEETRAFLMQVDAALGEARRLHPSPIVLAGTKPAVRAFARSSRNLHRLAATLVGQDAQTLADVHLATRAAMDRYLLSREAEALDALDRALASSPETVVTGAVRCWDAARWGSPRMLVAEEGFVFPARVTGSGVLPAESEVGAETEGDHLHDAVDDLIETVIERGGWVAFTRDGALERHDHIALLLRPKLPTQW